MALRSPFFDVRFRRRLIVRGKHRSILAVDGGSIDRGGRDGVPLLRGITEKAACRKVNHLPSRPRRACAPRSEARINFSFVSLSWIVPPDRF